MEPMIFWSCKKQDVAVQAILIDGTTAENRMGDWCKSVRVIGAEPKPPYLK
jgi:hypothetical protein